MSAILTKVLSVGQRIRLETDSYIDDIVTSNSVLSSDQVLEVLRRYRLEAKLPEPLVGVLVLGLRVTRQTNWHFWRTNKVVNHPESSLTRRQFPWCGQLVGHFPVEG